MGIAQSYRTLELEKNASLDDARKAYKDMVRVWHPDRFTDNPRLRAKANEKLKAINIAYGEIKKFMERDLLLRSDKTAKDQKNGSRSQKENVGRSIGHVVGTAFSRFCSILLNLRFKEYYNELMFSNNGGTKGSSRRQKTHRSKLSRSIGSRGRTRKKRKRFSEVMDEIAQSKKRNSKE